MKKLLKIGVGLVLSVVVLTVALVLTLPLWVGPVVTGVAPGLGAKFLGTDVKLASFALNPYTGHVALQGLEIANPKGSFDEPVAVRVDALSVDLVTGSLFSNCIHVRDITIENPFVSYVYDEGGRNNFDAILAHLKGADAPAAEAKAAEAKTEAKPVQKTEADGLRFRIDRLAITGTTVKYRMIVLPVPIPVLTGIGADSPDGVTLAEAVDMVWNTIKDTFSAAGGLLGSGMKLLNNGTNDFLKQTDGAVKDANKQAKALGDTAVKATKNLTEGVKKLGDLFK